MSKASASKSKSKKQLSIPEVRLFRSVIVHWEGEGIYMLGNHRYVRITNLKDMEYKMRNRSWSNPVYLHVEDTVQ